METDNSSTNSDKQNQAVIKLMSLGCKKFNMDPKKGIEFLVQNNVLEGGMSVGAVAMVILFLNFVGMEILKNGCHGNLKIIPMVTVPLPGRGPQQDRDWRLPRREKRL